MNQTHEKINPLEMQEWLESLAEVVDHQGIAYAQQLITQLAKKVSGADSIAFKGTTTPYVNTLLSTEGIDYPGNRVLEEKIQAMIRWNAIVMVLRATRKDKALGGHLSSYASSSLLYEMGFNHFFHAKNDQHLGDLLFIQGHSSPGIYARAFLEGRLSENQLGLFRQEANGKQGISSYPHPRLMPDFWQFATVSMGLGPLQAIFQARFMRYLENRQLIKPNLQRHIWVFCGDGEMDEPESLGNIALAAREQLDNLIFVVNCNLQRLDGPVRGNGKIVQELEGIFQGAGWHVIKVLWGKKWDRLLERDETGALHQRLMDCVDGELQSFIARDGAYFREQFFGVSAELLELVKDYSDDELHALALDRGGHDADKVHAAYHHATNYRQGPVVILAHSVKGYGLGEIGQGRNTTHNLKTMTSDELKVVRDFLQLPLSDQQVSELSFYRPDENSSEAYYLQQQRQSLGGFLPKRIARYDEKLSVPELTDFKAILSGSGEREISTTMAFVRILGVLLKNKMLKESIVPIVPDESRTFGMEGLFRQIGIYAPFGQQYTPEDRSQLMYYKESTDGQYLQEGINEPGAMSSWMAAATSYANHGKPMIPFYIYYSMFGAQRVGDLVWAAGDMRARGFLIGATAGRTTLAGEGLQHQDGHSHILFNTVPCAVTYDPAFGYELAVIIRHGLYRMVECEEDVLFYITCGNDNYVHPAMPAESIADQSELSDHIVRGMYCYQRQDNATVQLLGSGAIFPEVIYAAEKLQQDFELASNIWSVTSFNELGRDVTRVQREQLLGKSAQSFVEDCLAGEQGVIVAATDYMKQYAEQIRPAILQPYTVLGTDGFGCSDTRAQLREKFEVNANWIAYAAVKSLVEQSLIDQSCLNKAQQLYVIDSEKTNPMDL